MKKSARMWYSCRLVYIYTKERVGVNRYIVPEKKVNVIRKRVNHLREGRQAFPGERVNLFRTHPSALSTPDS